MGREIKNHLEAAGIRERHCVVALPASWVMSQHTIVPELAPEDANSFLQIEAEKGFPVIRRSCRSRGLSTARRRGLRHPAGRAQRPA